MIEARQTAGDTEERAALVHREIFQLGALIALAIAAFVLTRAIAISNREMTLRDAAEWFRRGEEAMQAGHVDEAIDALRRATVRNRDDRRYVLGLAEALARKQDQEGARSVLMTLRESEPEDREINLQLARLAASRQDVTEAARFYHNALYAPWPNEMLGARRASQNSSWSGSCSIMNRPHGRQPNCWRWLPTCRTRLRFTWKWRSCSPTRATNAHALDQFQRALRQDPGNRAAIAGAGLAAFSLGDYAGARSFLQRLPPDADVGRATRVLTDLVLSRDPLAARIGATERRRRLVADVGYVSERIQTCIDSGNAERRVAVAGHRGAGLRGAARDTGDAGAGHRGSWRRCDRSRRVRDRQAMRADLPRSIRRWH